jgi:8-oxo-dGTP pyrophosphatase MutT (NUDIX family)
MTDSYVAWLRGQIGTMKVPLVSATACVRDDQGRVLWQKRGDTGTWALPGGMIERDENIHDCLLREVFEETGLEVRMTRLVGIYSSPDFDVSYPNGDQVQPVAITFECHVIGGALQADGLESLALVWHPANDPPPTLPKLRWMSLDLDSPEPVYWRGAPGNGRPELPLHRLLRPYLGQALFIQPAAAAFIQDEGGRVLLQRRGDTFDWGIPGGGMELGERIDQAIVHEVKEETGLDVVPERIIGIYSDEDLVVEYPNGDRVKFVSVLFECRITGGILEPDGDETLELKYFPPDALPAMKRRFLRRVLDGLAGYEAPVIS